MPRKIDLFSFRKRPTTLAEIDEEPTPEPVVAYAWEDDEDSKDDDNSAARRPTDLGRANVRSTTWSIHFDLPESLRGLATLRLTFCGTHSGCNVEVLVNGKPVGETGELPSTSAMQRDGIRAYWVERPISFDATLLKEGTNVIQLHSRANSWAQGVMYDCVRLELDDGKVAAKR